MLRVALGMPPATVERHCCWDPAAVPVAAMNACAKLELKRPQQRARDIGYTVSRARSPNRVKAKLGIQHKIPWTNPHTSSTTKVPEQ